MSTEKMREEFEAWASDRLGLTTRKLSSGLYQSFGMHTAWEAWQASRAAIEVELSEPYAVIGDYAACGGGRSVLDVEYAEKITDQMCKKIPVYDRAQLEAAGLKVKP